jgi:hypothetical protein
METYSSKSRFKELSLRVKRSPVPSEARQLLRLPRAAPSQRLRRIATPACRNLPLRRAGTHLSGARNDRMGKGFHSLNRNLGDLLTTFLLSINLILVMVGVRFTPLEIMPRCSLRARGSSEPEAGPAAAVGLDFRIIPGSTP